MAKDFGDLRVTSTDDGLEFNTFGEVIILSELEISKLVGHLAYWLALRTSQNQKEEIKRLKSKVNLMIRTLDIDGRYVIEEEKEEESSEP